MAQTDPRTDDAPAASPALAAVADFVLRRPARTFPREVLEAAAWQLLDTLGVAIAAVPTASGVIARDIAAELYGAGSARHRARMMFDGRAVSQAGAAFALATQIDNLDGHDGYSPTKGHVGVVVVPALAALAEGLPELGGVEALAALAVGYEIAGRAGTALHATACDYHTSGAWNELGVAAMAARLWDLDDNQLRQALGIAEYHGPRSQMMREIANPTMLHDGSGVGALNGLTAAVLALHGFAGAPAITVETADVAGHWADLGSFWQTRHQYIKPYPICRWAHAAIDATRALMLAHDLDAADIARLRVNSFGHAAELFRGMPDTTSKAQYSLPFAVAAYVLNGRIGVEHITGAGLADPAAAAFLDRIEVHEAARHSSRFPEGRWADVEIVTTDGRLLASGDVHARGGPEAPLSRADILDKFREFASPVVGEGRADALRDAVLGLAEEGSRFAAVAGLLYDAPAGIRRYAA